MVKKRLADRVDLMGEIRIRRDEQGELSVSVPASVIRRVFEGFRNEKSLEQRLSENYEFLARVALSGYKEKIK